jgi:hypothetical protein
MTDTSMITYPRDKVRITAAYTPALVNGVLYLGNPETVEIELNDDTVPTDPAELIAFLTSLVDSLFRTPTVTPVGVAVDPDPGMPAVTDQARQEVRAA